MGNRDRRGTSIGILWTEQPARYAITFEGGKRLINLAPTARAEISTAQKIVFIQALSDNFHLDWLHIHRLLKSLCVVDFRPLYKDQVSHSQREPHLQLG
jgi:hypothetical protein